MAAEEVLHAYRHLYRGLLRAVRFSKPSRYTIRDHLRVLFRDKNAVLEPRAFRRTLLFIERAGQERGLEHRVLKNLIHVTWWKQQEVTKPWKGVKIETNFPRKTTEFQKHLSGTAYHHYDATVAMLNKSLGLCIRDYLKRAYYIP